MMPHDTFGPPWKLLAQLFGRLLGRISKIGVVNIDVLRDNRFDASADTISCLSLLDPDWPEIAGWAVFVLQAGGLVLSGMVASYAKRRALLIFRKHLFLLVQLGGLEPPTSCSTDRRSNQLSYNCIPHASPQKGGSRMGRKLGATPRFGKAAE
jgi:hypothetical protein